MSAVVYCLFPCCPSSDYHRCLLLLRCINVDVQHCHATSHQLPRHSVAPWQSSQGRSLHQKSRPSPFLLPHLHPFTTLFIPANRTLFDMEWMCSNSRKPLLVSAYVCFSLFHAWISGTCRHTQTVWGCIHTYFLNTAGGHRCASPLHRASPLMLHCG